MAKKTNTTDTFNQALATFLEWGPAMSIPIEMRLKKVLPGASDDEIAKVIREFSGMRSTAWSIVIDQLESKQSEDEGRARVAGLDERMSADNAAMLYTQVRVGAARDGYQ